jgi:hypothetical protein
MPRGVPQKRVACSLADPQDIFCGKSNEPYSLTVRWMRAVRWTISD